MNKNSKENSKLKEDDTNEISLSVRWWEKKRIIYNLIALTGGLLVYFLRSEVPNGISPFDNYFVIVFWLFGANIFYTCGWGSEILLNYYFKIRFWSDRFRMTCFILGSLFSFCWMFLLARDFI